MLELVGKRLPNFAIIDQENIKSTILHLEPHNYWVYYVNINLRQQYGISVAESKTWNVPVASRSEESPHIRESKIVLDSGFHVRIPHTGFHTCLAEFGFWTQSLLGFRILWPVFQIPKPRAQLFEGQLALNPGLTLTRVSFSCVQKHFLR